MSVNFVHVNNYTEDSIHLFKELWFMGNDKEIARTTKRFFGDLFVPRSDTIPMNPEKKTPIPHFYNASNTDPF